MLATHDFAVRQDGFTSGMTLVVGCGVGRGTSLAFDGAVPENWHIDLLSAYDLDTLDRTVGKGLDLPGAPQIGPLAQEVKAVVPEAVTTDRDGIYGINDAQLAPVLIEAIKELHGEVEGLKAQLAAVSNK